MNSCFDSVDYPPWYRMLLECVEAYESEVHDEWFRKIKSYIKNNSQTKIYLSKATTNKDSQNIRRNTTAVFKELANKSIASKSLLGIQGQTQIKDNSLSIDSFGINHVEENDNLDVFPSLDLTKIRSVLQIVPLDKQPNVQKHLDGTFGDMVRRYSIIKPLKIPSKQRKDSAEKNKIRNSLQKRRNGMWSYFTKESLRQDNDIRCIDEIGEDSFKSFEEFCIDLRAHFKIESNFYSGLIKEFIVCVCDTFVDIKDHHESITRIVKSTITIWEIICPSILELYYERYSDENLSQCILLELLTMEISDFIFTAKYAFYKVPGAIRWTTIESIILNKIEQENLQAIKSFQSGLVNLIKTQAHLEDIHVLLLLDENSIEAIKKIMLGQLERPEFLLDCFQTGNKQSNSAYATQSELRFCKLGMESQDEGSPFSKLYCLIKMVLIIPEIIDDFYKKYAIHASYLITSEELFPILIKKIVEIQPKQLLNNLLFVSMFLNDDMKAGEQGFAINTMLAVVNYISTFN